MVSPDHRRALNLLANSSRGCLDSLLLGHGFSPDIIAELIDTGHATAMREQAAAIKVIRLRITDAGRRVLAEAG